MKKKVALCLLTKEEREKVLSTARSEERRVGKEC